MLLLWHCMVPQSTSVWDIGDLNPCLNHYVIILQVIISWQFTYRIVYSNYYYFSPTYLFLISRKFAYMMKWSGWKYCNGSIHDDLWRPQIRAVKDKKRMTWDIVNALNIERRPQFECDHVLRLHNENNFPCLPFTYSPPWHSCNGTWGMMSDLL